MTLVAIVIWTVGGGLFPPETRWSELTCAELLANAEMTLEAYGGGRVEMSCEEFKPLHEADFKDHKGEYDDQ